jgi:hypothetical protein
MKTIEIYWKTVTYSIHKNFTMWREFKLYILKIVMSGAKEWVLRNSKNWVIGEF